MQRLVHVDLGQRDVILEAPRHRLPVRVHHAERLVTFAHRVDDDSKRDQVVNLFEAEPQLLHLRVNRKEMLGTPGDFRLHPAFVEPSRENIDHTRDIFLALLALGGDESFERPVRARIQVAKRQILEFRFEPVNTQPMRDRRIDFHRLARDLLLPVRRQMIERAHVVQPVGELDQHHPDVMRHRNDHLAEILRLLFLAALEGDLRDLGHAVDQLGDFSAEVRSALRPATRAYLRPRRAADR